MMRYSKILYPAKCVDDQRIHAKYFEIRKICVHARRTVFSSWNMLQMTSKMKLLLKSCFINV